MRVAWVSCLLLAAAMAGCSSSDTAERTLGGSCGGGSEASFQPVIIDVGSTDGDDAEIDVEPDDDLLRFSAEAQGYEGTWTVRLIRPDGQVAMEEQLEAGERGTRKDVADPVAGTWIARVSFEQTVGSGGVSLSAATFKGDMDRGCGFDDAPQFDD